MPQLRVAGTEYIQEMARAFRGRVQLGQICSSRRIQSLILQYWVIRFLNGGLFRSDGRFGTSYPRGAILKFWNFPERIKLGIG